MINPEVNPDFEDLLEYLKQNRGFDFTAYKRNSLKRRIDKRMEEVPVPTYRDYVDYLEVHPGEFEELFNTILINVTSFFRDPAAWAFLKETVFPAIVAQKAPGEMIRIWSAACASGEEAYSLAILLGEVIGEEQLRNRVKIYATDVDEEELTHARQALYTDKDLEAVEPELREKYFEKGNGTNTRSFRKDLRRVLIFGRHDLIRDAPISHIDLLACRNSLMYFNADVQRKILSRFFFALADEGYLLLGKAEMMVTHLHSYDVVDLRNRVFRKRSAGLTPERDLTPALKDINDRQSIEHKMRDAAFELDPLPQIVVDASGHIAQVNATARKLTGLAVQDVGRLLQDLELSYRPIELRSIIDRVYKDNCTVIEEEVMWPVPPGEPRWFDFVILPLRDGDKPPMGVKIIFMDVTRDRHLNDQLVQAKQEIETAYEELQSTNEELETTNEELQSTVEEIETTNEELQSTNEELVTMNEELQSTNEGAQAINDELHELTVQMNRANVFLQSILTTLGRAVIVVDEELCVHLWNNHAEEMWGLRAEEVLQKSLMNLDMGLSVRTLRPVLQDCLSSDGKLHELTVAAVNRRGRSFHCKVTCNCINDQSHFRGAVIIMEDADIFGSSHSVN